VRFTASVAAFAQAGIRSDSGNRTARAGLTAISTVSSKG
jgi:hypothetical protein